MKIIFIISVIFLVSSCTDSAYDAYIGKLNDPAEINCYSGGKLIYSGRSTGAVRNAHQSDGYQFREAKTNRFLEVSGDCVINYSLNE